MLHGIDPKEPAEDCPSGGGAPLIDPGPTSSHGGRVNWGDGHRQRSSDARHGGGDSEQSLFN